MLQPTFRGGDAGFPATRWSVIEGVRSGDTAERRRALETLCQEYWKPVYKYVRLRWSRGAEDAQDITQGFFAEMLERELLNRFDADDNSSYEQLAQQYGITVTAVTNALAWARREFRKMALERLRRTCGSDEEFQRETKAVFGWQAQ